MTTEALLGFLDLAGIFVFAASGALAAARKSMDVFGFIVIATITAVGGGTLRDVTLGILPVFWIENSQPLILAIVAAVVVFVAERHIRSRLGVLLWLDALGLALFASIGAEKALSAGASGLIATMMGIISAVFGGMIRDVVCNEIPLILQREVYATAAFAGALAVVLSTAAGLDATTSVILGTVIGFMVRAMAIILNLSLPGPPGRAPR